MHSFLVRASVLCFDAQRSHVCSQFEVNNSKREKKLTDIKKNYIFFNSINRFPAITAEETADITVDGLLKNKLTIVAPKMDGFFVGMIQCLPEKIKHLVRDYILFERQSKMFKMPMKSA